MKLILKNKNNVLKQVLKSTIHVLCFSLILNCIYSVQVLAAKSVTSNNKKTITVKESIIDIQGKTFRKIEYKNEAYFLELTEGSQNNESNLRVLCQKNISQPEIPGLVKVGVQTTKRSHFFIEGLKQSCSEVLGGVRKEILVDPRLRVGFQYDFKTEEDYLKSANSKNELFKTMKLLVTPIDGVVFKADW